MVAGSEEEAEKVTDHLLERKLVACVNYFPIKSKYWWKGKIENDSEVAMIAKSRTELADEVITEVKKIHSYEVPVVDIIPINKCYKELDSWLLLETTKVD
jgi:periplasmic divalent cation tolerance protein